MNFYNFHQSGQPRPDPSRFDIAPKPSGTKALGKVVFKPKDLTRPITSKALYILEGEPRGDSS